MSAPRILIVEGDLVEAQNLEDAIFEIPERETSEEGISRRYWWNARVVHAGTLSAALAALSDRQADLVLLNPSLPDSQGIDTFRLLKIQAPDLPVILILNGGADEQTGRIALREGAQDYLLKSRCDWESLSHAMQNALERARLISAFWKSFLIDLPTGLPNRTGFIYLAEMLQTAYSRVNKPLRMIVAALDGDPAAAPQQESELVRAAALLRRCINEGDLAGRIGALEFGVLSADLDMRELNARLVNCQPPGVRAPQFRWSDWRESNPAPGAMESIDRLIASAEMLLPERRASAAAAGSVH